MPQVPGSKDTTRKHHDSSTSSSLLHPKLLFTEYTTKPQPSPLPPKKPIHILNMEQFALSSAHSGAIQHIHTIQFAPSTIGLLREVRYAVTAVVIGWVAVTGVRAFFDRGRRS
ncbi:hypothetical protein C8035_v000701 [Colletotrichum spinosum]|uniref:Uncharacterized protein n=1 Tax=Colletotrichum spinosum TaxID=1347390 RepID=A0A4R8QAE0_9PEZI|nr:hypothetical protein C8035_v000701 [Colletotrichum spinosum]